MNSAAARLQFPVPSIHAETRQKVDLGTAPARRQLLSIQCGSAGKMVVACCRQFYCRSLFVVVWSLCWLRPGLARRTVVQLNYDFEEEQPIGSFVGDVKHDANLTSLYSASVVNQLRFTFMRQYSTPLFDIDSATGIVRSKARVDREQLCPSVGIERCVVRIDVAVRPVDYFRIVRLTVSVIDVNDHTPTFPDRQLSVDVLESAEVGTLITLSLAADPDSQPFSVAEYRATATTDVFRLVHEQGLGAGGYGALRLELVSGLDREQNDEYRMMITAVDGGSPARTGSTQLTVRVLDVNDNRPRFIHANYDVTVPEDVAPGTTLLHVAAVDPDDGLNGRVVYELGRQVGPSLMPAGSLPFAVNNVTGAVVIVSSLDRDGGTSRYEFAVTARDLGRDAMETTCLVVVQLTDVNDHAPDILIDGLIATVLPETIWPQSPSSSAEVAQVTENAREGTFVAHVTVIDPDQGAAGRFNCSLADCTEENCDDVNATDYFRLNQFDETEFQLVTASDATIDREQRTSFQLSVVCTDFGRPPLTSHRQVRVVIADVNDCVPTFTSDVYRAEVIENNYVGAALLATTAYDADRGDNARLTYSLLGPQSRDFRVDPDTGEITAFRSFDREMTLTLSFTVVARDAGSPPLSGTATVVVSILDVNDNSPQFDVGAGGEYLFSIDEDQPAGTFVGQVSALDPDSGDNGNVSYAILTDASFVWSPSDVSLDSVHGVFALDQFTGVLVTRLQLDAELESTHRFQVVAADSGVPSRSSTVSVVVSVNDINDHSPRFIFPSSTSGNVVHMPRSSVPPGYVIVAVSATDPDVERSSSSIVYGLADDSHCFRIDRLSGILSVADETQLIDKEDGWTFALTVTATDQGGLQASEMLYVVVNSSMSEDALSYVGSGRWEAFTVDRHHVLMVVCLVALCAVLVVGLVVLIAVVRARQRRSAAKRRSRRYNCRAAACMRMRLDHGAAGSAPAGHLPPVNAWNSTDAAAQSLLLVRQTNDVDSDDMRNGQQPLVKCYSNDGSADSSLINGSRTLIKRSSYSNRKVSFDKYRTRSVLL